MINDVAGGGIQISSSLPSRSGAEQQQRLRLYVHIIIIYVHVYSKFDGQWIREVTTEYSFGWKRSKNSCTHPLPTLPPWVYISVCNFFDRFVTRWRVYCCTVRAMFWVQTLRITQMWPSKTVVLHNIEFRH